MARHRVNVFNPQTVEGVLEYVHEHLDKLDEISEGVNAKELADEYKRSFESVPLDATGSGQLILPGRQGFDRVLERIATLVSGATVGNTTLWVDSLTPSNLIEAIGSQQQTMTVANLGQVIVYSDAFNNNIHLGQSNRLIVQFSGYAANATATINLQEKLLRKAEPVHHLKAAEYGLA